MNYKAFKVTAVVDFVEIEVRLSGKSNAVAVRNTMPELALSVRAIDPGSGAPYPKVLSTTATEIFWVRIQDPPSHTALARTIEDFSVRSARRGHQICGEPRLIAIEIALDAYAKDETQTGPQDLAALLAHMVRGMQTVASDNRRKFHSYRGSVEAPARNVEGSARDFLNGYNVGIGNTDDAHYQHLYFKTTDGSTERLAPLPEKEHCARYENRYSGQVLRERFGSFAELATFDFSTLADHYSFRVEDMSKPASERLALAASSQIGSPSVSGKRRRHDGQRSRQFPVVHQRGTRADAELNKRSRNALESLTRRWNRADKPPNEG